MTIYNVGYTNPSAIIYNANSDSQWITNQSIYPVYLSADANCNATNADYILPPNSSVEWDANKFCYALMQTPYTGNVQVTDNALNIINSNSVTAGSSSAYDVLYKGPYTASTPWIVLNTQGYQSIRMKIFPFTTPRPINVTTGSGGFGTAAAPINVTNMSQLYFATIFTDAYPSYAAYNNATLTQLAAASNYQVTDYYWVTNTLLANSNNLNNYGYEVVTDVKGPLFIPNYSNFNTGSATTVPTYTPNVTATSGTGTGTAGANTISMSAVGNVNLLQVGLNVSGTGIGTGAKIVSFTSGATPTITLSVVNSGAVSGTITFSYTASWGLEVTGHSIKIPQLYKEFSYPNYSTTVTSFTTSFITLDTRSWGASFTAVPVANNFSLQLPAYSGKVRIDIDELYDAAPTTKGWWQVYGSNTQQSAAATYVPTTVSPPSTRRFRGSIIVQGIRDPLTILFGAGAGYVSMTPTINITTYGGEDT